MLESLDRAHSAESCPSRRALPFKLKVGRVVPCAGSRCNRKRRARRDAPYLRRGFIVPARCFKTAEALALKQ